MLTALQPQIQEIQDSLTNAVDKVGHDSDATSLRSIVESVAGIKTSVENLTPTLEAFKELQLCNSKLESDIVNITNDRDHLRSTVNEWQTTTSTSVNALANLSQRPSETTSEKNAHVDLMRKHEFTSSSLKSVTKELGECQEEKARLEQQLSDCQENIQQQKNDHQQQQEAFALQHSENLAAQRRTFQATIDELRTQVDQLKQTNKETGDKVVSLNAVSSQQDQALSDIRAKHDKAHSEAQRLRSQVAVLSDSLEANEAQIDTLRAKESELSRLKPQAQVDADEVQRLQHFEFTCIQLGSEVEDLKKTIAEQDNRTAVQDATLKKAEADARQLPGLQQSIDELQVARGDLAKKLEQAEALAGTLPQLRKQLESVQQAKSNMSTELQRLRPLEEQLYTVTEEKDAVARELVQAKNLLAQARLQTDANTDLQTQLSARDQRIAELEQQVS